MEFRFEASGKAVHLDDQVVDWARRYESNMLDANELTHLAAVLTAFPWRHGEFAVEIGAYLGRTTVFMAKVLQRLGRTVPILSIDPFERYQPNPLNPQGNYSAYVENIARNDVGNVCLPLASFSGYAAEVIAEKVGVLVVDGDHSYAAAVQDLRLFAPKLRPGGFLFIDDYGFAYPGVAQAVDEFLGGNPDFILHAKSYFVVAERASV